jgi:threonine dehydratase
MTLLTAQELEETCALLPGEIKDTPLRQARTPGLWLKLETLQPTGAYKIRAAWTALSRMGPQAREKGVALSSSGNFAGAFTWAAHRLGIPAHLVFTPSVSGLKVALAQQHPCTIHRCEDRYEARYELLQALGRQGILTIDHRLDRNVYLGHATIGWECAPLAANFQRVLLPLSTGGLAIGVSAALRAGGYRGQILGIQPAGNPTLYRSWKSGRPVRTEGTDTCCDALTATSVPEPAFNLLRTHLDDVLLVAEDSVRSAVRFLMLEEGVVVEPGAAVGMAAILESQIPAKGSLLVLTGRNIEAAVLEASLGARPETMA